MKFALTTTMINCDMRVARSRDPKASFVCLHLIAGAWSAECRGVRAIIKRGFFNVSDLMIEFGAFYIWT